MKDYGERGKQVKTLDNYYRIIAIVNDAHTKRAMAWISPTEIGLRAGKTYT